MNNTIPPFRQTGLQAYQQAARKAGPVQQEAAAEASQAEQPKAAARSEALTPSEEQMIAQQFPEKPDISLRVYGPQRQAQTVDPGAIGSRLDVRG